MKAYKAIIIGGYGLYNLGDDALMLANVNLLKRFYPADQIALYCVNAPYIKRMLPGVSVIPLNKGGTHHTDLLVYGGGTMFYSFANTMLASVPERLLKVLRSPNHLLRALKRRVYPVRFEAKQ